MRTNIRLKRHKSAHKDSLTAHAATTTRTANEAKNNNGHINPNYFITIVYICQYQKYYSTMASTVQITPTIAAPTAQPSKKQVRRLILCAGFAAKQLS